MAKVGIKLADGKFYPILDEYGSSGKNLVLTTVCDGQTSAQIDFFRNGKTAADEMQYIGTLVVDNLSEKYAGETSIELRVRSTGDGHILAEAYEIDGTGGAQKLEIDIEVLDAKKTDADVGIDDEWGSGIKVAAKRRFNPIVPVVIAAILFLLAAVVFLFLFLSQGSPQPLNAYVEPQTREEAVILLPPARGDAASIPEAPLSPSVSGNDKDLRNVSDSSLVPDMSRKALRTEFVP
jgi:hypothetical protein